MSNKPAKRFLRITWLALQVAGRFARRFVVRVYAAALMLAIVWLTFLAVRYLVRSLAVPGITPAQIAALPVRLDRTTMGRGRSAFAALDAAEHPRSPLAHYHRLDSWIQPDTFNDCTRGGCHAPLPHSKRKEVRAFLNMHATSLHCGVCHMKQAETPRPLVWYGLHDGDPREPPAILQAYALLTEPDAGAKWEKEGSSRQRRLVSALRTAAAEAHDLPVLRELAEHFAAYRVGSYGFDRLLEDAPAVLDRHFRGEYGAKLAIRDARTGRPVLGHPDTRKAVKDWLSRKDEAGGDERKALLSAVHPLKSETALSCTDCHRAEGSLIDFTGLGYPDSRIERFIDPIVFRMIEHINAGRPFSLPRTVGADRGAEPP